MHFTFYSEVGNYYPNEPQKAERVCVFIDIFQHKQVAYQHSYNEDFTGVYFSWEEIVLILGQNTYKKTITELEDFGFELDGINSQYGNKLYFFKPLEHEYKGKRAPITNNYLKRNMKSAKKLKKKKLSYIARIIYSNLRHLEYTCTEAEYREAITNNYPAYVSEKKALRKPVLGLAEYLKENMNFYKLIEGFRKARGLELVNFIWEDKFGKRVHSIMSCTPRAIKQAGYVKLYGESVFKPDLHQSQPTILAKTLEELIGVNDFTTDFNEVPDIYEHLGEKLDLPKQFPHLTSEEVRGIAKTVMFTMLYGRADGKGQKGFNALYPQAGKEITRLKEMKFEENPSKKLHSNLCWLMQRKETEIFREVWRELHYKGIVFIPVHDEVIVPESEAEAVLEIMNSVLSKHLKRFKVNVKN